MKRKKSSLIALSILTTIAMIVVGIVLVITQSQNTGVCILGILLLIAGMTSGISYIATYNKFVKLDYKVKQSLSLIDIHFKLRFDLIPNLVETVKGYEKHEKQVFIEIAKLRNISKGLEGTKEKVENANQILAKMQQILVIAENYPELKASEHYKKLMDELIIIEDKLVASRRIYSSNVNAFNTLVDSFPSKLVADMHGIETKEFFKIDTGERINVEVSFANKVGGANEN